MPIKAKPFGYQERFDWGADIHSVSYDGSLSMRVLRNRNSDDGIEVTFSQVDGFRLLDELSVAEYWIAEDFPSGYPVLEVFDGGWAKEEEDASATSSSNVNGSSSRLVRASVYFRSWNQKFETQIDLQRFRHSYVVANGCFGPKADTQQVTSGHPIGALPNAFFKPKSAPAASNISIIS